MEVTKMIEGFIEINNGIAKCMLEKQGGLHPMLIVFGIDDKEQAQIEHYTIPLPTLDNNQGKEYIAKSLIPMILRKAESKGLKIICVCFIMDSWFTMYESKGEDIKDAYAEATRLRNEGKLKRQSMLMCTYETKLITKSFRFQYETINEKIVWGKIHKDGELLGRFANLWKSPAHN